jgi:hypothetical protein
MSKASSLGKSLKEQNRWQLWLVIAANAVLFYVVLQTDAMTISGLKALFSTAANLIPVGFAIVITTIANGLLSADFKARLVFLRWAHALPGHRAFSVHALSDPRIDLPKLKKACGNKLPSDPVEQNRVWYRFYKSVEDAPAVSQVHRDFLLTRDYAGLAALFLIIFGPMAVAGVQSWRISLTYCLFLVVQFLLVRHSAATYGVRFTKTVLAQKSAAPK